MHISLHWLQLLAHEEDESSPLEWQWAKSQQKDTT